MSDFGYSNFLKQFSTIDTIQSIKIFKLKITNMKKRTFLALLFFATAVFTGCKKDIDIREDYVGIYSVTETWTENSKIISKPVFSMPIYKSTLNSSLLLLNNFSNYGIGITAEATVEDNVITIPLQTLSNSISIDGSGTLTGTTLTYNHTERVNGITIKITTTAILK
jgi:hypothetical protein